MCSGRGDRPLHLPGFPIRTSPDQSLVADSPGLIAGSYVLLRLLVPRHPPCALINLATTDDARVHCAVLKMRAEPAPGRLAAPGTRSWPGDSRLRSRSLRTQQRARPGHSREPEFPASARHRRAAAVLTRPGGCPDRIASAPLTSAPPPGACPEGGSGRCPPGQRQLLLRKEVIQPHLPVRLPCYDFVPIAGPTFDGSFPYGLGHRLRVLPTFVT